MLGFRDRGGGPPLLPHAVEVMQGPDSLAQGIGIRNRGRDIGFGEQYGLGQAAPVRQVAGQGGRERASGAVSGIGEDTVRLENFPFDAPRRS